MDAYWELTYSYNSNIVKVKFTGPVNDLFIWEFEM